MTKKQITYEQLNWRHKVFVHVIFYLYSAFSVVAGVGAFTLVGLMEVKPLGAFIVALMTSSTLFLLLFEGLDRFLDDEGACNCNRCREAR